MAWTAVADVPFVPVGAVDFSQIIGVEFYMIDRDFNFYSCHIPTGAWTHLANPPFIGTNVFRSLAYRNGMLYCIDEGAGPEPFGRRISWYNPTTNIWASSAQVPFASLYINIRSFCFADDDTIWAWVKRSGLNRIKCVRYVISTDTWTEFPNNTGVLAEIQSRCAAINAAGTIVYGGHQGVAGGCYGSYTIATDAYAQSAAHAGFGYCWAHDPERLWYATSGGAIVDRRYGYFDIETLAYNDNYWEPGPPSRTAVSFLGSDLDAIVDNAQTIAGANPMVWWNGLVVPTVQTDAATAVTAVSATLNGTLSDDGGGACNCGFEYGPTIAYGDTTGTQSRTTGQTFSQVLLGLNRAQIYHYRAFATNGAGTSYGADGTFTTLGVLPTVTTDPATGIVNNSAQLNATLDTGGLICRGRFEWGETPAYGKTTPIQNIAIGGTSFSATIFPLKPNTTYYFRAFATNGLGTDYGAQRSFTTTQVPHYPSTILPNVQTNPATLITEHAARLNGVVIEDGGVMGDTRFQWGLTTEYGNNTPWQQGYGKGDEFLVDLNNLAEGQGFHFRTQFRGGGGLISGSDMTFNTLSPLGPVTLITDEIMQLLEAV